MSVVLAQGDFFREFFRSLFSANLFVTGVVLTIGAVLLFYGSIYLFNATNLGKRLGFLVTGAALFGWLTITSMLFVIYAPRGPKPDNIEGLNAVEIRIIPVTYSAGVPGAVPGVPGGATPVRGVAREILGVISAGRLLPRGGRPGRPASVRPEVWSLCSRLPGGD